jgi:hypothetical protein
MRKKLLQNTLFAAIAAWVLYLTQAQVAPNVAMDSSVSVTYLAAAR